MHVLEQVQRGAAAAVEQVDVIGFGGERLGAREGVHQRVEFEQARGRQRMLLAQQGAHLGQVAAHRRVRVAEQRGEHAQALRHRWQ